MNCCCSSGSLRVSSIRLCSSSLASSSRPSLREAFHPMDPVVDVIAFQVVIDQGVSFQELAAQAAADAEAGIGAGTILWVAHRKVYLRDAADVLFGEGAVEQVEAQHAMTVGKQFVEFLAGTDQDRTLRPGQAGVFQALVALFLVDAREILFGATVGFHVHERIHPGQSVVDPAVGDVVRYAAEGHHVDDVRSDAGHQRHRAQRDLVDLPPGLVRRIAVVTARHLELGDLEGLLVVDPDPALRQFEHIGLADIDLQGVFEQLPLDALLMLATLRQLVGAAAQQKAAAQGGGE